MTEISLANAVNLAVILIFIAFLIKMFEKVSRRSEIRLIDASNAIIEQIKNYVVDFTKKRVFGIKLLTVALTTNNLKVQMNHFAYIFINKDMDMNNDADHQKMLDERKLLQLPGVRKSVVTTSQSNVNMNNPTRLESRIEKHCEIDINPSTPKMKSVKRNHMDDIEKGGLGMNSKINQVDMHTPPRPTMRKIDPQQQQQSTITNAQDELNNKTLWRQLYFRSVRRFHSVGSMIGYFYWLKRYRNQVDKGEMLYCANPKYDLDIISHIFQYICYLVFTLFVAVCIFHNQSDSSYVVSVIVVFVLGMILNFFFLQVDFKYQKVQIKDLESSVKLQAWESIAIQQDKYNQEMANMNQPAHVIEHNPAVVNQPMLSKRNIPPPPSRNPPLSKRSDWKRPNSGVSTYPIQGDNNGNQANNNNPIVIGAEDSNTNVHQNQQNGNKATLTNSFQNQNSNNNHTTQLNRDSSKSSGVHSIGQPPQESNNMVLSPPKESSPTAFDSKDEIQILLEERISNRLDKFHGVLFLLTVLFGGIGVYLLFNQKEMIGGFVMLTCFFVVLADFFLRYLVCWVISAVIFLRYKSTKSTEYKQEINEEVGWVLTQLNKLENGCIQEENDFKSPADKKIAVLASVKSPSKSVKKIMESLKKIVSPSKRRAQNSPMKDIDEQQDEMQFLPNYNGENIPIKHLIFNQDGRNGNDFDTQTQHDYSINNVSVNNPIMKRINLISKGNNQNNQSQDSLDIQEEIAIKRVNYTPASQVKNQYSSKKQEQQPRVKDFTLDYQQNHIKIYSDRNQNSLRQDSGKNGIINFDDSADTYIDSINLQPDPVQEKTKKNKKNNSRRSSAGQIAPLPSQIINYNTTVNNNSTNNDGEIHSGSLCGKKKSQRSHRSKRDFHTSMEQQNKEFASKNKILLESTQNDLRSCEMLDNSMKPLQAAAEQNYRDSSLIHNRSISGYDASHLFTAGDVTQAHNQSNVLPSNINLKHDGSVLMSEINQGMQNYVNNTILDPNDSINAYRYPTYEKNTIDNNTLQPPSSSENRYGQDSRDRSTSLQTRNIQQQLALKQRREQQLKNKSSMQSKHTRNKSEDNARMSISQNADIHIDNQQSILVEQQQQLCLNDSVDLQNKKISLSVGNFYESPRNKENNFNNKLHKEATIINNLIPQAQPNQLSYANSLSFLHNQTQNDGTMIMQQQQKDLSIFFNNISDNDNSVQVNPTSPERRKITMKKPLSPIPPTDLKDRQDSEFNEGRSQHKRKRIFDTDGDDDEHNKYRVHGKSDTKINNPANLLHPYYNVQQIKGFDMNTSEHSFSNNLSGQLSINIPENKSVMRDMGAQDKNLQTKSLSNGRIMKSILEQGNRNKENYNLRSYDFENKQQGQSQIPTSNPGSRKNSTSQSNVPLKSIVKKKDWEKFSNNSPYLEFLPQMLNGQKDELKEKEKELKHKIDKSKRNSRKGSTELSDKIKKVVDNYGYEIQKTEQRNVLVSKKSARSVKSQESKRTLDNKPVHEDKEMYEENQKSILHDNTSNILNDSTNIGGNNGNLDTFYGINKEKKQYPHQAHKLMKSKKPPLSSQNNILNKNLMMKENNIQNYPNSARVNLNSIALRQTTTLEGGDMSTMENNMATHSNHDGFFERNNNEFVIKPNNTNSIQFDVANSDRQHHKLELNEDFDFDAHFQNFRDNENSMSSFDHSHFAYPRSVNNQN